MTTLAVGDRAPDFTLPANGGKTFSRLDFDGAYLVLYFYPKDNTPGCTTEALNFSALIEDFEEVGAKVVGVSRDSVRKHDNFIARHDLGVTLLSDEDGETVRNYGVWVEKKMYGKTYMGIQRATFLIDCDGRIAHIWPKVKVKDHAREVLEILKSHSS
ncbi:MAG: thioredoxin-dependent thiol peroxidase [Hyphomonadaceae bacterium]|nr:thioredoxin-dependent thiol peroxidase [Hyphomonadaceae bacterium]MBC6411604.1 thioredoxin-dependent thiol peroxidase [Hyphomonadaceae bacterium]